MLQSLQTMPQCQEENMNYEFYYDEEDEEELLESKNSS